MVPSPTGIGPESPGAANTEFGQKVATLSEPGQGSAWKMVAAIAASCLIHAGILVFPYLGTSSDASRARLTAAGLPHGQLTARLTGNQPAAHADPAPIAVVNAVAVDVTTGDPAMADQSPATPQREGLGLLPIEGNVYYSTSQLSQPPIPLNEVALDDPAVAPVIASGKMVMTLWINAQGEVENAVVDETELPGLFTRPTVEAFKRLRFRPGELGGRSVGSIMKIEVTYEDERALPLPSAGAVSGDTVADR